MKSNSACCWSGCLPTIAVGKQPIHPSHHPSHPSHHIIHPISSCMENTAASKKVFFLSKSTSKVFIGWYAGIGYLSNVTLSSATYSPGQNLSKFVEHCECPDGYLGQFCESCAPGYHRDPLNGGPFGTCIPCNCNEHSEDCDAETGSSLCHHF